MLSSVHVVSTCSLCCMAWLTVHVHTCTFFFDILSPEVQSHSDDSHMHLTPPCSARALGIPTFSFAHNLVLLVTQIINLAVLSATRGHIP